MKRTYCWRRLDFAGLELMELELGADGVEARSSLIDADEAPFALSLHWRLDRAWRSRSLSITRADADAETRLEIARNAQGWRINGEDRPDLAECLEIDVSATPFCNGLALRGLGREPGELTALYVDAADLSVQPSRQRYERISDLRWRYVDLGVAKGFEAVLEFDDDLVVTRYESLFERI